MSESDRWMGDITGKGRPLHLDEVRKLGRYARCRTGGSMLHEYDLDQFWVTDLGADEPERRPHLNPSSVPMGPWFHGPLCDCEACGAEME